MNHDGQWESGQYGTAIVQRKGRGCGSVGKSWEPHWLNPLHDRDKQGLTEAVHDVLIARNFCRGMNYGPRALGTFSPEVEQLDGIASWTRRTVADSDNHTFNSAALYGNGLVRVGIETHSIELMAGGMPVWLTARLIGDFVDRTDEYLDVVVED